VTRSDPAFKAACRRFGVEADLMAAIITVESGWDPWAYRYEPAFEWLYKPEEMAKASGITLTSMRVLQKSSFGLCQLMGARALELGLKGSPAKLFDEATNLEFGCRHFATLMARYDDRSDQIAAYNAGSARREPLTGLYVNQIYVTKVLSALGK
jgi:soluble lytic murein transglycosylase-like protein